MDYFPQRAEKEKFAENEIMIRLQCVEEYHDCEYVGMRSRSMGYDTEAIIRCGQTEGHVMIYVHGHQNYPYMRELTNLIPFLQKKEADRLANEAAIDISFAWFYRSGV